MLWTQKYAPSKFTELLFTDSVHITALKWLRNWTKDSPILILSGPPGHSKSLLIRIMSKMVKRNLITSEYHSFKSENYISATSECSTITGIKNMILIEEADDSFYKEILKEKKKYKIPIVITCYDKYNPIFKEKDFFVLEIKKLAPLLVLNRINDILKKEKCIINQNNLFKMIEESNSDMRSILNTLQLFGKCINITSLRIRNNFQVINDILTHGVKEIGEITQPILSLIHTNYLDASGVPDAYEISESFSLTNTLSNEYSFLPSLKLRCKKMSFFPSKHKICPFLKRKNHFVLCNKIMPYYNLIKEYSSEYLKEINEKYEINVKKEEIKEIKEIVKSNKIFKLKFKGGRSFAVRRDVDIQEFYE